MSSQFRKQILRMIEWCNLVLGFYWFVFVLSVIFCRNGFYLFWIFYGRLNQRGYFQSVYRSQFIPRVCCETGWKRARYQVFYRFLWWVLRKVLVTYHSGRLSTKTVIFFDEITESVNKMWIPSPMESTRIYVCDGGFRMQQGLECNRIRQNETSSMNFQFVV